jgi:hypothetical protein
VELQLQQELEGLLEGQWLRVLVFLIAEEHFLALSDGENDDE